MQRDDMALRIIAKLDDANFSVARILGFKAYQWDTLVSLGFGLGKPSEETIAAVRRIILDREVARYDRAKKAKGRQ